MRQMAGKDEETSLEDSSFGPGHFTYYCKEILVYASMYELTMHVHIFSLI